MVRRAAGASGIITAPCHVPMVCWAPGDAPFPGDSNAKVRFPAGRFAAPARGAPRRCRARGGRKARAGGQGRHAAAERLAHRARGQPPRRGRPAARDDAPPGRPASRDHERRLVEAEPARRRHRAPPGDPEADARPRLVRPRLAPRRQAALLGGRRGQLDPRGGVGRLQARAGPQPRGPTPAVRAEREAGERRLHGRPRAHEGRQRAVRGAGLRQGGRGARAPGRLRARAARAARRGLRVVLAPDERAVYVSVWGGARVAVLEPRTLAPIAEIETGEHPNAMQFSKDGRASLRRLRQHQRRLGGGRRVAKDGGAHRRRALAQGAAGVDAQRARALSRWRHAARRERRQQQRRGGRRHAPGREPVPGVHPDRLVPDWRRVRSGRGAGAGAVRQGPEPGRQPARAAARRDARRHELHRRAAERRALDREAAGRRRAESDDRAGVRDQRLQRRPARRAARPSERLARSPAASASRRRSSTSST